MKIAGSALPWVVIHGLLVAWLTGSVAVCPLRCRGVAAIPCGDVSTAALGDCTHRHSGDDVHGSRSGDPSGHHDPSGRPDGHGDDHGSEPCTPSECPCVCNGALVEIGDRIEPDGAALEGASPVLAPEAVAAISLDRATRSFSAVAAPPARADSALALRAVLSCWLL